MTTCGPYELLEKIGEGSSGAVYRARSLDSDLLVAVQVLDHDPPEALLQAQQTLKDSVDSPHLCQFLEYGSNKDGKRFVVYPLLSDGDLEHRRETFDGGRIPLRVALRWCIDALKGLEEIHQAGFLHGDIKPSNLMLDGDKVVVCDFSTLTPLSGDWQGDLKNGTPEYLPSDESLLRTPQRDLHALGITLMGLLTGKLVATAEEAVPSRYDALLPSAVDDVVARAVGLEARFESAARMRHTVETLLTGPAPEKVSLSPPTRRVSWEEKTLARPLWPWLVAVLMLPLGAWAATWRAPTPAQAQPTAAWSGVGVAPAAVENRLVWQVLVLGRPVAAFVAADEAAGGESAKDRAHWCAAVLEEAHFRKRQLDFVTKRELPDSCEVYLKVEGEPEKFLFRVTKAESKLFDRKAPLVAKAWTVLISDTTELLRPGAAKEKSGAGKLLLTPWQRRFETLRGQQGKLDQEARVALLWEAFDSLPSEQRDDLEKSYRELPEESL